MRDCLPPEENHGVIVGLLLAVVAGIFLFWALDVTSTPSWGGVLPLFDENKTDYSQTMANIHGCGHLPQNETAALGFGVLGFITGGVFGWICGAARPRG